MLIINLGIVITTLGSGLPATLRSYLTLIVPKHERALLYTMILLFTDLGAVLGEPLMALVLAAGIGAGKGIAMGLPFFLGAALYFISGLCIWFLKAPRNTTQEESDENSGP